MHINRRLAQSRQRLSSVIYISGPRGQFGVCAMRLQCTGHANSRQPCSICSTSRVCAVSRRAYRVRRRLGTTFCASLFRLILVSSVTWDFPVCTDIVTPIGYVRQLLIRGHLLQPVCEVYPSVSFLYVPVWCVYKLTVVMCHMLKLCVPPSHSGFSHFFSL